MTKFNTFKNLINKSKYWQIVGVYDELDNELTKIDWQKNNNISLKLLQKDSTINNGVLITFADSNHKARLAFDNGTPDEQGVPFTIDNQNDWHAFNELTNIITIISQND